MGTTDESDNFINYESLSMLGDGVGNNILDLRPPLSELELLTATRPKLNPVVAIKSCLTEVKFEEYHSRLQVARDVIGVVRRLSHGNDESYGGKLGKERERGGQLESARYGIAHILGEKAVVYAMNWDFFAGSLGEAAGEKFVRAAKLARTQHLPFVAMYASSGARQQENTLALIQMQRIANAIGRFKEDSDQPHIGVLVGQVWGGISASAVPLADLTVALEGTDFGFSGPRVIETFQKSVVPLGSQSAEAAALDGNLDVLTIDPNELVTYIGKLLKVTRRDKNVKLTAVSRPVLDLIVDDELSRPITFGANGYASALKENNTGTHIVKVSLRKSKPQTKDLLMEQYEALVSDAGRVDAEFIMQHAFSDCVPLYNHYTVGDVKKYPEIIASLARIGEQPFMVIGDQPSYINRGTFVSKQLANPKPEDFEYQVRMMSFAKRLKLPVVFLTDTLGAEPTLVSEKRGQSRAIANALLSAARYPHPIITLITGALGSGGGLATGPFKDGVLMLDTALAFVSEPQSKASILYNTAHPTPEQVSLTLQTNKSTAGDHHVLELIDKVVSSGIGPYDTIRNIREALLDSFLEIQDLSPRQRRNRIAKRVGSRGLSKD